MYQPRPSLHRRAAFLAMVAVLTAGAGSAGAQSATTDGGALVAWVENAADADAVLRTYLGDGPLTRFDAFGNSEPLAPLALALVLAGCASFPSESYGIGIGSRHSVPAATLMQHPELYSGKPVVVRVLREIVEQARTGIVDPVVVKGLLSVVPAFAPGSLVRLDDGQRAVVAEFDPLHPCRPTVQVLRVTGRGGRLGDATPASR